ncbi:histidine kinase [Reichenbachiella carrageenanivorans]|uniref:Histidine kinase n=1 Tax=Reichenbachiella carrageenanivorans TaxID=2979869 RepID=A0ABY6D326_9BACT|nr:histidine kinase [Reichenbachiella carrageenanivorans]UXX80164.1 histidine kinase [Reichenbachiella carrageenanivorans]
MQITKQRAYWLCQIIGWSFWGLLNFSVLLLQSRKVTSTDFFGAVFQVVFYIGSTHFLRVQIKKKEWFAFSSIQLIPRILISNLVLGLVNYVLLLLVSYLMGTLIMSVELKPINMLLSILGPTSMYFLWSLVYFTYHYFEEYNKSLQYQAVIRDTELNNLRAQLNPHFIFNALNSIRALVDEDPKKSKSAITQLSNILRNSLQVDKEKLVLLQDEMATVEDYLSLESIRYEERLRVELNISERTYKIKIPPMMIQTLVENGIKHGISKLKSGGTINVMSRIEGDFLVVQIRNSGVYLENKPTKKSGYGLVNTQKRIELIYGDMARFSIKNETENTVLTELVLPKGY